jgi:hypothetical protein
VNHGCDFGFNSGIKGMINLKLQNSNIITFMKFVNHFMSTVRTLENHTKDFIAILKKTTHGVNTCEEHYYYYYY